MLTESIKKRIEESGEEGLNTKDLVQKFYEHLHYGQAFEVEPARDHHINWLMELAAMEIWAISEEYPDAGIGDTMTDELIVGRVGQLLKTK